MIKLCFNVLFLLEENSAILSDISKKVLGKMTENELFEFINIFKNKEDKDEIRFHAIELLRARGAISKVCNAFLQRSVL